MKKKFLAIAFAMAATLVLTLGGTVPVFASEVTADIDVALQTGDTFLVPHKTISVKSTLAEAYWTCVNTLDTKS